MRLAGIPVRFLCYSEKTIQFLKRYLPEDVSPETEADITIDARNLAIDQDAMNEVLERPYSEYCELIALASDSLMRTGRCFYHGAVFVWKGMAWMLTAPSGTGKTTQFRNLSALCGREIFCLNGDKPALEFRSDRRIMVHDSPWRGKEGWGRSGTSYPLAGVFYLGQGDHNEVRELPYKAWLVPIYCQFFSSRTTEESLRYLAEFERSLMKNVPICFLINRGDMESSRLLYRTMEQLYLKAKSVND